MYLKVPTWLLFCALSQTLGGDKPHTEKQEVFIGLFPCSLLSSANAKYHKCSFEKILKDDVKNILNKYKIQLDQALALMLVKQRSSDKTKPGPVYKENLPAV